MLKIIKQQAVTEDFELGFGKVHQTRDLDGVPTDFEYTKVSAETIPAKLEDGTEDVIQNSLDEKETIAKADTKFAYKNGDTTEVFKADTPVADADVTNKGFVDTAISDSYSLVTNNFAAKSDVLLRDNTDIYSPSEQYNPATKRYVDEKVVQIGAGDMAKATYDSNDNGKVDTAEAVGTVAAADVLGYKGTALDANSTSETGFYEGTAISNAPETGAGTLTVLKAGTDITQMFSGAKEWVRDSLTSSWNSYVLSKDIADDLTTNDSTKVLSAKQGKNLNDIIQGFSGVPIGTVTMFHGQISNLPNDWKFCDGSNGTPDLRDMFISGATDEGDIGTTGGTLTATMPDHVHSATHTHTGVTSDAGAHSHSASHNHTANTNTAGNHAHTYVSYNTTRQQGTYNATPIATLLKDTATRSTSVAGNHTHSVTVNTKSLTTSTETAHSHALAIDEAAITTGVASSGGDNRPPYYKLAYIIKVA